MPKRHLTEEGIAELNKLLSELRKNQTVTVVYYCDYQKEYLQLTGPVVKIDPYRKPLQVGAVGIVFSETFKIIIDGDIG